MSPINTNGRPIEMNTALQHWQTPQWNECRPTMPMAVPALENQFRPYAGAHRSLQSAIPGHNHLPSKKKRKIRPSTRGVTAHTDSAILQAPISDLP